VRLEVPAGALDADVTFRLARDGSSAPPLVGLNALSPVYAVTPHGQAFANGALLSIPLAAAQLPAGGVPVLLKAEPGGVWRVMKNGSTDPARVAADIDGLSWFVIGSCSTGANDPFTLFAVDCPTGHELRLTIFDGQNQPTEILRGPNGVQLPLWRVIDVPQTRTFRVTWTRPAAVNRTDTVSIGGLGGSGISSTVASPAAWQVNGSFTTDFNVTIDPARVLGASGVNGRTLRVRAFAEYTTTAFRLGFGNVPVGFSFETDIPIEVRYRGPTPTLGAPPVNIGVVEGQPATFSVFASVTPASMLAYRWFRRPDVNATFVPIVGATQASYTLSPTTLADNGAQFQVEVCVQGSTRCVTSPPASLAVTRAPVAPTFTMQPASSAVVAGQTASFTAMATGVPAPAIRWQTAPGGNPAFTDISSAACAQTPPAASGDVTTATCTVGPVAIGDNGRRYRALAINAVAAAGLPSAEATLTVSAAPVAPSIDAQPSAVTTTIGGSATFVVSASGTAPLAYRWRVNGTPLPASGSFVIGACNGSVGASGASLTLTAVSAGCTGTTVTVVVSNGINPDATSLPAALTVNLPPTSGPCFNGSSSWCYARPLPQANTLNGLVFVGGTGFVAAGAGGTTLRTSDNGATWQAAFESARTEWFDLASPTPALLVATGLPRVPAGQPSGVFTSTDNGQTWTRRVTAPVNGDVGRIAFANASLGVAAGINGIWRTTDGGLTWTLIGNPPALNNIVSVVTGGIVWANSTTVLIYGAQGGILRSTDAGLTWADVTPSSAQDDLWEMAFNAAGVGIAVGPSQQVLRSTDAGATWQTISTAMTDTGAGVAFADASTVVVLGSLTQTMRSIDGGLTWTVGFREGGSNLYRVRFAGSTVGLAVGLHGQILRTSDAGVTWSRIGGGVLDQRVNSLSRSPSGSVLLAGALNAPLLRSTDAGATWTSTGAPYRAAAFASDQVVVAVRPIMQQIARSTDAGQNWSLVHDQAGGPLESVTMATSSIGFAVGAGGLVLRSIDGGQNWSAVASGTTVPLKASGCLTSTLCLAGGFGGVLLRSTDAGATWSVGSVPTIAGGDIRTISRLTDTIAVLAADDGLWRSVDAGQTWARVYTRTLGSVQAISFNGAGVGIAGGADGILRSTDQGLTWVRQDLPIAFSPYSALWFDAGIVLVGGEGGALLRNTQSGAP
jgi:photosystem II stability/assembly factor-like uncharacterized protein